MEERIGDLLDCVLVEVEKICIAVAAGWSDASVIELQPWVNSIGTSLHAGNLRPRHDPR